MYKHIKIKDFLKSEHLFNRRSALRLYEAAGNKNWIVVLDFKDIETVTKSFFWQLMFEFSKNRLQYVSFKNMNESVSKMYKLAKESMLTQTKPSQAETINSDDTTIVHI